MKKILIIEDDKALVQTLSAALESEDYEVLTAFDGRDGLQLAEKKICDLIILDLKLPSLNGFEVCRNLREKGNLTPIIFLTGEKKEEIDKILGLELGGDDYLTKPFSTRELIARIKAVIRRAQPETGKLQEFSFGDIHIDFQKKIATKGEKELYFTAKEYELLGLLIQHRGEVVSRETILNQVWGYDKFPTTRTIDTFIHSLRKKIEDTPSRPVHLITVPWSGYKFKD
jgi:DNA-binding response OmpR family regulator